VVNTITPGPVAASLPKSDNILLVLCRYCPSIVGDESVVVPGCVWLRLQKGSGPPSLITASCLVIALHCEFFLLQSSKRVPRTGPQTQLHAYVDVVSFLPAIEHAQCTIYVAGTRAVRAECSKQVYKEALACTVPVKHPGMRPRSMTSLWWKGYGDTSYQKFTPTHVPAKANITCAFQPCFIRAKTGRRSQPLGKRHQTAVRNRLKLFNF